MCIRRYSVKILIPAHRIHYTETKIIFTTAPHDNNNSRGDVTTEEVLELQGFFGRLIIWETLGTACVALLLCFMYAGTCTNYCSLAGSQE